MKKYPFHIGVGIGTDVQGLCLQSKGGAVSYPFKSYDGNVTFEKPVTGNRFFDYNEEGMAHYGLLAEWVEVLRKEDSKYSENIMDIFMNSAEAYLQMWERARRQAGVSKN